MSRKALHAADMVIFEEMNPRPHFQPRGFALHTRGNVGQPEGDRILTQVGANVLIVEAVHTLAQKVECRSFGVASDVPVCSLVTHREPPDPGGTVASQRPFSKRRSAELSSPERA